MQRQRRGVVFTATTIIVAIAMLGAANAVGAGVPAKIAFVRGSYNESVWTAAATGHGAKRLGGGDQALISPDGAKVAASLDQVAHGPALVIFAGGARHTFFDAAHVSATALAWSSDSRYVAVQLTSTSVSGRGSSLAIVDTSTWTSRTVADGETEGASFDRSGNLFYGLAPSLTFGATVNVYEVAAAPGGVRMQITTDGRSLNPLWTPKGIVYDHERVRGEEFPAYQLWLLSGGNARQLTHMPVDSLVSGPVPLQADADGNRLVGAYVGQDTDYAIAIQISPLRVRTVSLGNTYPEAAGISQDGRVLLLDVGSFEQAPSNGWIETQPFFGGRATRLTRGADASWNR